MNQGEVGLFGDPGEGGEPGLKVKPQLTVKLNPVETFQRLFESVNDPVCRETPGWRDPAEEWGLLVRL